MATRRDHGSGKYSPGGTPIPLLVAALVEAARRRHLLDEGGARLLQDAALEAQVTHLTDWFPLLQRGLPGLDCAALLRLLPKGDEAFGMYRPLAHLADGGMGSVWLTTSADGLNLAVIKHTRLDSGKDNAAEDRLRRRFSREAAIHRRLHHPNVLRCLDVGISSIGQCYLVLEYIAGGDLADLVERYGALPESVALTLIYQVVDGLSEAHRLRLVHRDIKPGNLFLTAEGTAKLSDFGIARKEDDANAQLTLSGTVLGSPFYMSPEQVNAEADLDIRSDIYGIGGLLCFCLSGRPPYPGTAMEAMRQHVTAPLPELRRQGLSLSDGTAAIIARCLAKDRCQRYPDPLELRAALAEARNEAGDANVGSWLQGDSLGAVVDLEQTLGPRDKMPGASGRSHTPTPATLHQVSSAIRFREPEEIMALIAARASQRDQNAASTEVAAAVPLSAPPAESPVSRRPATEPMLPHWLVLTAGQEQEIHLYSQPSLTLGKLAKPPVDLTTLLYPIDSNTVACNRISRSHCILQSNHRGFSVTDLNTSNGTVLDGIPLPPNISTPITNGAQLVLAQVLELSLALVARRNLPQPPSDLPQATYEALIITRCTNRPTLSYALVCRSVLIGGIGSDVVVPGFPAGCGLLVAWTPNGWHQRLHMEGHPSGAWNPLAIGLVIGQGNQRIAVRMGDYALLTR